MQDRHRNDARQHKWGFYFFGVLELLRPPIIFKRKKRQPKKKNLERKKEKGVELRTEGNRLLTTANSLVGEAVARCTCRKQHSTLLPSRAQARTTFWDPFQTLAGWIC